MRNESLYNLAQENEVLVFLNYLPKAVMRVARNKTLWKGEGRPPKDLYDVLVCLMIQHYIGFSTRRSMGIIEVFTSFARMHVEIPCFKTLCNYRNKECIKPYLDRLIDETSKPLVLLEHDFSTDASGASTQTFSSWYSLRVGKKIHHRDHIMSHVTTSRLLNAAVAVNVECKKGKDSVYMREHVERVRRNFMIKDWSGDSMYLSRANCNAVAEAGGNPWFRLKKNTTAKPKRLVAWKRMVIALRSDPEAMKRYHKRSNSESTFSAKKRKFGSSVRSKNDSAKENEEHSKWVGYNFSVLSRAKYQYGIKAFEKD